MLVTALVYVRLPPYQEVRGHLPPSLTVVNIVSFRKEWSEAAERIRKFPKCCVTFSSLRLTRSLANQTQRDSVRNEESTEMAGRDWPLFLSAKQPA